MISEEHIISQTKHWLRSFIIKLNICPFAKHVVEKNTLKIAVSNVKTIEKGLEDLVMELMFLDQNAGVETTLLIFPTLCRDFFDYLDFVDMAEIVLHDQGYEGVYQLATFHPDYCFADTDFNDVSNYTNRSPYPMLHLLREDSVEKAIAHYGDTETIPKNNIATMHKLGLEQIKKLLAAL
jgi:hypothetical protein